MAKLQCGVVVQSHTVHILVITLVHAGLTLALWLHAPASSTVSLTKDSTLWIGSTSLPSISCWGLNLIWKSAHLVQVLQIGIFHCLASLSMWWDWFTHTLLDAKLCSYTVIYTSTRCLAHVVTHYFHRFQRLAVYDIDSSNVGPPPPVWGQGEVHRPWALFHDTTVHATDCSTCRGFQTIALHVMSIDMRCQGYQHFWRSDRCDKAYLASFKRARAVGIRGCFVVV